MNKEYHRKWREKNKESVKKSRKKHYEKNTENILKRNKEYRGKVKKEDREHYLALKKVEKERNHWDYIIRGRTRHKYGKAEVCQKCGSNKNVEHHHFTKPYHEDKFIDLCQKCHKTIKIE